MSRIPFRERVCTQETETPQVPSLLDNTQHNKTAVSTRAGFGGKKTQNSSGWALLQENQTLFSQGCSSGRFLRGSLRANHHSSSAAAGAARGLCRHRSWAHTCNKHSTFTLISTGLFITLLPGVFFKVVREKLHSHGPVGLFTELFLNEKKKITHQAGNFFNHYSPFYFL